MMERGVNIGLSFANSIKVVIPVGKDVTVCTFGFIMSNIWNSIKYIDSLTEVSVHVQ